MIDVSIRPLSLRHPWRLSRNTYHEKHNVFVRIERDGISGWGEAAPNIRYDEDPKTTEARLQAVAGILAAGDWRQYAELRRTLDAAIPAQQCARAAVDMALLDWAGQALNTPLYRLWGLDPRKMPDTSFSLAIDSPDETRRKAQAAKDFAVLKVKLGGGIDRETIAAIRSVSDQPIRVDANEGWKTREEALRNIEWMAGQQVEFVEQPMPAGRLEDIGWLRERSPMPLVADEDVKTIADIPRLAEVYDGINIKLMKSGGLQEAHAMITLGKALGLRIMIGCMIETSLAITAAAHLAPLCDWADLDGNLLITNDFFRGASLNEGKLALPDRPGLGVEVIQ